MSDSEISTIDDKPEVKRRAKVEEPKPGRRTLRIHATDGDGGQSDVFVGVNGYAYNIKRGQPVDVPQEVIDALSNASVTRYRSNQDGSTEMFETPRYAFTVS